MSKPNGAVIELAAALQKCFDAATNKAERAVERLEGKMEIRLGKQDATLRKIWRQCGGREDERLPIDD